MPASEPVTPAPSAPAAPRAVRATEELTAADVRVMLTAPSREGLLALLGITGADAHELLPQADAVAADEELLAEVTTIANRLRAEAGLETTAVDLAADKERLDALQQHLLPGEGLLVILAAVVSTATVRAWHTARGLTTEQSWHVLADLGQQMRVHRRGTGRLGLHQLNWVSLNWAGRLVHLGRLQFDLHRRAIHGAPERWVLGTHIPATGPLDPSAVEESFAAATAYFTEHYPDLQGDRGKEAPRFGHEFVCDSWLISDAFAEITGPESNLARFAALWEPIAIREDAADGALFFTFGLRPPVDPASLPRRTRLERAVADRRADGRGWTGGVGHLVR